MKKIAALIIALPATLYAPVNNLCPFLRTHLLCWIGKHIYIYIYSNTTRAGT